jgi:hypothetical protein
MVVATCVPASAGALSVAITSQADAPVTLMSCTFTKQMVPLARGVSVEGFLTGVVFKNTAAKPVVQVTFLFTMRDTAGAVIDSHMLTSTGTFAPGVEIDNIHWLTVDDWPTLGGVDCSIQRVMFKEDPAWTPPHR